MSQINETIDVAVPARVAYDQWTQFEEYPEFMDGIDAVFQMDDRTIEWHAAIAGMPKTWRAKITEQVPDQRIAWTSIEGARNAGVVTFHRLDDEHTRVALQMEVEPDGAVESIGDALGLVQRRAAGDLERFKAFIEERGTATGAWRGTVE
ncbi:MAG: SRPBCC family protein, partial [Candidatus Limnocylindrales bacterium]